ncbi:MAG: hypothetical protein HPY61_13285 [Methanotrichaceae archaeon]|nr:hypothetical protein [Methanotrichaceae archaeon]
MDESSKFVNWYYLQQFPVFSDELLAATSAILEGGYPETRRAILSEPGAEGDRMSLALLSVVEGMERFGLDLDTASFLMLNLNRIMQSLTSVR